MSKLKKDLILLIGVALLSTIFVWLPFFLQINKFFSISIPQGGMATIMKNFDGLYYIIISKSLYIPEAIKTMVSFDLSPLYYSAHFPLFALLIKLLGIILPHTWAMLVITLLSSVLAVFVFYKFLKDFKLTSNPFFLTLVFLFLPARWLIVRSVGSAEPTFIALILACFYFFKKEKIWFAAIMGSLAQMTKPPGILIFIGLLAFILFENRKILIKDFAKLVKKYYPLLLIPISLLLVFFYYKVVYNDFFAYFHSGDNIHLFWPPYQVFNKTAAWVGTIWLEEIIYIFLLGLLGIILLFKKGLKDLAFFSLVFYLSLIFVSHRDISRYSLPMIPFIIIGFENAIQKKEFKIAFYLTLLPIYLYTINFIAGNTLAIADWAPFL